MEICREDARELVGQDLPVDEIIHILEKDAVGVSNRTIIENIIRLDEMGRRLILRLPMVKDLTDTTENIDGVIRLCGRLKNLFALELLPCHNLGAGKYAGLNLPYEVGLAAPEPDTVRSIINRMHAHGLNTRICGPG